MESKNNWKAWLYLSPALILMSLFTFFPLINTFVVSFMSSYRNYMLGKPTGFTFKNYGVVLGAVEVTKGTGVYDKDFFSWNSPSALTNTLLITVITVPVSVIIALLIAILLNNIKPLKKFFQTIFFMPYVTNVIAVGMVFSVLFQKGGAFNSMLGLTKDWIGSGSSWGSCMFVLCLYIIWTALPYKILIFMSGLQGIDKQYYDAALYELFQLCASAHVGFLAKHIVEMSFLVYRLSRVAEKLRPHPCADGFATVGCHACRGDGAHLGRVQSYA